MSKISKPISHAAQDGQLGCCGEAIHQQNLPSIQALNVPIRF